MNGTHKRSGLARWWSGLWNSPMPSIGCEISPSGVSLARWSGHSGALESAAWKAIAQGALEASPLRENVRQPEELDRSFSEAVSALGIATRRNGSKLEDAVLVLPDQVARLFVLDFDRFPEKLSEGLPLVKWRLKKSLPFDVESAAISYFVQRPGAQVQVVAAASPLSVVRQYESVAEKFGLRPRWVTLSTLAALNVVDSPTNGDAANGVLVLKYSPPGFTTAILQGGALCLFRTVGLSESDGALNSADVLASVYPSLAYFQDNFQQNVTQAYVCGLGENRAAIESALEQELHLNVKPLVSSTDAFGAAAGTQQAERHFAALLGISQEQQNG